MKDLQSSTDDKLNEMGDIWGTQEKQIENMAPLRFSSWPWTILKGILGVIIVTTIYLLYNLAEIPWTIGESGIAQQTVKIAPFFVSFVLGMTFESGKKALVFSIIVGMTSLFLLYVILSYPYRMNLFDYGPGYSAYMWWYILLSFINMISFMPVAAVLASSTNVYE